MHPGMKEQITQSVKGFRLPRYSEIPNVGLYLEQVTKYVSEFFAPVMADAITGSMISNYVKRGLLSSPVRKQYSREQIAYLIYIAAMKTVLSMEDIKLMIQIQRRTYAPEVAYNYFCSEFENILEYIFGQKKTPEVIGIENTDEKIMLRDAVVAAVHVIYLNKLFAALHTREKPSVENAE